MITSFGNAAARDLYDDKDTRATRKLPPDLRRAAMRKLLYLHDAGELSDLRVPPGNRLERLKGDMAGYHSIRINKQWRITFRWQGDSAEDVRIVDYHD